MDWRERYYYLFRTPYATYDEFLVAFRDVAPSLKIHAPYNHMKNDMGYDGNVLGIYIEGMVSCRFSDALNFESAFHAEEELDKGYYKLEQLSKELTGQ